MLTSAIRPHNPNIKNIQWLMQPHLLYTYSATTMYNVMGFQKVPENITQNKEIIGYFLEKFQYCNYAF